jgi:hypothetical protein
MKPLFIFAVLFFTTSKTFSQNYILSEGEYMDTTAVLNDTTCKDYNNYYYGVGGKYLKSSYTLLKEAQVFLLAQNKMYSGSGYVTFRFMIDCSGKKMKRTQVLQTDANYEAYHFDKVLVSELYDFTNTLDKWHIAKSKDGIAYAYHAFISFKIKNGKIITVIP